MIHQIIGYLGLCLSMGVVYPQIYKTIKTKNIKGVSLVMYLQLSLACILLIIKAYLTGAYFFIISYSMTLISSLIMIVLIKKYK